MPLLISPTLHSPADTTTCEGEHQEEPITQAEDTLACSGIKAMSNNTHLVSRGGLHVSLETY